MQKSLLSKSLWFIAIVAGCFIIGQVILIILLYIGGADMTQADNIENLISTMKSPIPFKIGIGLTNLITFALSALAFCTLAIKEHIPNYFKLNKGFDWGWMGLSMLLMIVSYPLLAYSMIFLESIELPEWMQTMDDQSIETLMSLLEMNGIGDLILNLVIIAIIPAIGEELLFRGVLQKELKGVMSNPHIAIFITAFIFSAIHMQVQGFPPKFILGLVLGYVYHYSKNLIYPILLHLINNGSQVFALYFAGDNISALESAEAPDLHWSVPIVSLLAALYIFTLLKNKSQPNVVSA